VLAEAPTNTQAILRHDIVALSERTPYVQWGNSLLLWVSGIILAALLVPAHRVSLGTLPMGNLAT